MSESSTETPPAEDSAQSKADEQPKPEQADETDWKAEARKWEQRAKDNNTKAQEFDKQRKAAMTEAERAVVEAEERGRTTAVTDFGKRLATSEIKSAAAELNADLTGVFDYLDLSRFLDEAGEPDMKAISAFVDGLPTKDDGKPRAPKPDAHQGRPGAAAPKSTADSFAEFFRQNLSER